MVYRCVSVSEFFRKNGSGAEQNFRRPIGLARGRAQLLRVGSYLASGLQHGSLRPVEGRCPLLFPHLRYPLCGERILVFNL